MYKNLSLILILGLLLTGCGKAEKDIDCLVNAGEVCITKISKTPAVDGNYWEGSKAICGGIQNMPTAIDLAKIAAFVYEGNPRFPVEETRTGLSRNVINFKLFDLYKSGYFYIFSDETEEAKKYANVRTYYQKQTDWVSVVSSSGSNIVTVCVKHK